jgi:hypothetical protein
MTLRRLALGGLVFALNACRSEPTEPAPLPASYELILAPPGARGARAAGTDAAPPVPNEGPLAPTEADDPEPELDDGGGVPADSGVMMDAGAGVAL